MSLNGGYCMSIECSLHQIVGPYEPCREAFMINFLSQLLCNLNNDSAFNLDLVRCCRMLNSKSSVDEVSKLNSSQPSIRTSNGTSMPKKPVQNGYFGSPQISKVSS